MTMIADTVVGDDLALVRDFNREARAVNPEVSMFGIIDDVNPEDDPEIYRVLTDPEAEVIFSNVLLTEEGDVWWRGKPDEQGREVPPSHPNARFTVSVRHLAKLDPRIDDPLGVPVSAFVFGGKDFTAWPPVEEAFDWDHGIATKGAALESERTAAVLGRVGEVEFNPFAILDFLSISPGAFAELHFRFARRLEKVPKVFGVNYFLRGRDGGYLAEKRDKRVWRSGWSSGSTETRMLSRPQRGGYRFTKICAGCSTGSSGRSSASGSTRRCSPSGSRSSSRS